jgi:uncharacterized protein (TIGR04255 family)
MPQSYPAPPLVEALCEFQFLPAEPWDITVPGRLYERVREEFPEREQHATLRVGFQQQEGGLEQRLEMPPRMRLVRSDRSALIQVGPDLLAVNQLRPYPTWGPFRELVLSTLERYVEIARPLGLKRIGLRYINEIEVPAEKVELKDYFGYYPHLPASLPQEHGEFVARVALPYEEERDRLQVTLSSKPMAQAGHVAFILDLDYAAVRSGSVELTALPEWLEAAHSRVELVFEACITEATRKLFREDT